MFNRFETLALFGALLLGAPTTLAHDNSHTYAPPEVVFKGLDYAYRSPDTLGAGLVTLKFDNVGREAHHLQLARLNDGVTFERFTTTLQNGREAAYGLLEAVGGVGILPPGESQAVTVNLKKPGLYVALCVLPNDEGVPHLALGMIKPVRVVAPRTTSNTEAPKADLVVQMRDFGYDLPAVVSAGRQVWEVLNSGVQPHEMLVARLSQGKTMADVRAYLRRGEKGSQPYAFVGGAQAMVTTYSSLVELELTPGSYVALCFVPDPATGKPHIALGMVQPFTVVAKAVQR